MTNQNNTVLMHQKQVTVLINLLKRTRTLLADPDGDQFTAEQLLADIENVLVPQVTGTHRHLSYQGVMEWTCPITGYSKDCWGEFNTDVNGNYYHYVYDDNDQLLYVVTEGGNQ